MIVVVVKFKKGGDKLYCFNSYWTKRMRIDFLQRVILIHSYLYYEKDSPVWSDKKYDEICMQLVEEQRGLYPGEIKDDTQYGYVFYDFDGTTGFDLFDRLTVKDKAQVIGMSNKILE